MEQTLVDNFLVPFDSAQHLKDWCFNYLDLDFPIGHVDPDSNSSPAEAMYEVYCNYRDDKFNEIPGYIWLSSRDSYKTLCESALAVIMMVQFNAPIAHLASIQTQSKKAVSYVNAFLRKCDPYLKAHGMRILSDSSSKPEIMLPNGNTAYVNIIICTVSGANSEHVPFMSFDELDTIRFPQAYEEAKLIPARYQNRGPLTVKCSTRKYSFGIMQKELDEAETSGEKILRWNIIDITEKCLPARHRPNEPKVKMFVSRDLPLERFTPQQFDKVSPDRKDQYDEIEAYAGCADCMILPVCRTRLAHRPDVDLGGLYKPIDVTIRQFKITSPEMAAAQLMCWRPTTAGLVYGRFQSEVAPTDTNVITPEMAWRSYTGEDAPPGVTADDLIDLLIRNGIKFKAGVDWGSTHAFAITVSCVLPNKQWWFVDAYARPGLEFEEMIELAEQVRDRYPIDKWYCDDSAPMFIKAFKKRRMPCPKFTKDVKGGVESVRAKVVDASSYRSLKVIKSDKTEYLITCFRKHSFALDQAGEPTEDPSDDEYADVMDTVRYQGQNLFPVNKKKGKDQPVKYPNHTPKMVSLVGQDAGADFLTLKVRELLERDKQEAVGRSQGGSIIWDFSGSEDDDQS